MIGFQPWRGWSIAVLVSLALTGITVAEPVPETERGETESRETEGREQRIRELWAELARLLGSLPAEQRDRLWQELQQQGLGTGPDEPPDARNELEVISENSFESPTPPSESEGSAEPAAISELSFESNAVEPAAKEPSSVSASKAAESRMSHSAEPEVSAVETPAPASETTGRRGCNTLQPFDTDGDQKLTGLDRYWRHFYLWLDRNGDGRIDDRELESPYEKGVRQISVNLRSFVRGKKKKARELQIWDEQYLLLDLDGDGWAGSPSAKDGALAVDAGAVRASGGPGLVGPGGETLDGVVAFRPGWSLKDSTGQSQALRCPRK